jgi:hypothetical protein
VPGHPANLTTTLGWASLGLGTFQTLAPGAFLRFVGARDDAEGRIVTVGACGLRELGAATGILALEQPRPVRTLWARIAGDVLDLGLLAVALRNRPARPRRLVGALVATAGITAADVVAATGNQRPPADQEVRAMQKQVSITVGCPASDAQSRWRQLATDEHGPFRLGPVEITGEEPGRMLAWSAAGGASAEGVIRFRPAPGDQGTELHLEMSEGVGPVGQAVQKLTGDEPFVLARDDLHRFKQIVETGEVVRSQGTPGGHRADEHLHQRPAQPLGRAQDDD